jgi:hypothetical protein
MAGPVQAATDPQRLQAGRVMSRGKVKSNSRFYRRTHKLVLLPGALLSRIGQKVHVDTGGAVARFGVVGSSRRTPSGK